MMWSPVDHQEKMLSTNLEKMQLNNIKADENKVYSHDKLSIDTSGTEEYDYKKNLILQQYQDYTEKSNESYNLQTIFETPKANSVQSRYIISNDNESNMHEKATRSANSLSYSSGYIVEENNKQVQNMFQTNLFSPDVKINSENGSARSNLNESRLENSWVSNDDGGYDICSLYNAPVSSNFSSPRPTSSSIPSLPDFRNQSKMCPTAPQFHPRSEQSFMSPSYSNYHPTVPMTIKSSDLDPTFQNKYMAPTSAINNQFSTIPRSNVFSSRNYGNQDDSISSNLTSSSLVNATGNRSISPRLRRCLQIAHDYANSIQKVNDDKSPMKSTKDKIRAKYEEAVDGYIYKIRFKRANRNFVLSPNAPRNILPGMMVKVEADRGEDLGIVLAKIRVEDFEEEIPTAGYRGRGFSSGQGDRKYVLRLATQQEKLLISEKAEDEEKVLQTIREKVVQRKLPMIILDAEYQFDRHKLTYFFEADRRIDFRELVSDLFSLYKTRIWMQQVDTSSLPSRDDLEMQLAIASGLLLPTATMGPSRLQKDNNQNYISDPSTYLSRIALENTAQVEHLARGSSTGYNVTDIGSSLGALNENTSWTGH